MNYWTLVDDAAMTHAEYSFTVMGVPAVVWVDRKFDGTFERVLMLNGVRCYKSETDQYPFTVGNRAISMRDEEGILVVNYGEVTLRLTPRMLYTNQHCLLENTACTLSADKSQVTLDYLKDAGMKGEIKLREWDSLSVEGPDGGMQWLSIRSGNVVEYTATERVVNGNILGAVCYTGSDHS
jgi:hypothetical protein